MALVYIQITPNIKTKLTQIIEKGTNLLRIDRIEDCSLGESRRSDGLLLLSRSLFFLIITFLNVCNIIM
jgi:hypothetical protein